MSEDFNLYVMRRLFNPKHAGSGEEGKSRRVTLKTTLTPQVQVALRKSVPTGKGQYGSPTVELALRFLLSLVGRMDLSRTCEALALAVIDRDQLVRNLRFTADFIETYKVSEEWEDTEKAS